MASLYVAPIAPQIGCWNKSKVCKKANHQLRSRVHSRSLPINSHEEILLMLLSTLCVCLYVWVRTHTSGSCILLWPFRGVPKENAFSNVVAISTLLLVSTNECNGACMQMCTCNWAAHCLYHFCKRVVVHFSCLEGGQVGGRQSCLSNMFLLHHQFMLWFFSWKRFGNKCWDFSPLLFFWNCSWKWEGRC